MKNLLIILLVAVIGFIFYMAYHKNEKKMPAEPTFQVASPYVSPPVKVYPCDPAVYKC